MDTGHFGFGRVRMDFIYHRGVTESFLIVH